MCKNPSPEIALATDLRALLESGLTIEPEQLRVIAQALYLDDPLTLPPAAAEQTMHAIQRKLTATSGADEDTDETEATAMRELALFPDASLRQAAELLALKHGADASASFDLTCLAEQLAGVEVKLRPAFATANLPAIRLEFDMADAMQFATRLRLYNKIPPQVANALKQVRQEAGENAFLAMRAACRGVRFSWKEHHLEFITRLLQGALDMPRCCKRLPAVLDWALGFAPIAGEDIPGAMAARRDELSRQLELAKEVDKVRDKHNFETRRMLGIIEPHLEPDAIRSELLLLDLASVATGWGVVPMHPQVMEQDLGDLESVDDMQEMMLRLGIF